MDIPERRTPVIYLRTFRMLTQDQEDAYLAEIRRTCYTTRYPFHVFRYRALPRFELEPVTIFYGGNGSGKSTILNVIAERLQVRRGAACNRSNFFEDYVRQCEAELASAWGQDVQERSRVITSDDVFDYLLNIRALNENIDCKREELLREYTEVRKSGYQLQSLDDYEELVRHLDAARRSGSGYVRKRLMQNVAERSNGESALSFFTEAIQENALYLLDEPENSLSAEKQLELQRFLSDSARFYGCQFLISTHSPFLLSMRGAKIYDLDADPVRVRPWTELENVRVYRDFFLQHESEFQAGVSP